MDLLCITCGEPWDMDYVLHEEPEEFERKGGAITHCPACPADGKSVLDPYRAEAVAALADVLGDDIDGLAASLEDFGLLE